MKAISRRFSDSKVSSLDGLVKEIRYKEQRLYKGEFGRKREMAYVHMPFARLESPFNLYRLSGEGQSTIDPLLDGEEID